MSNPFVEQWSYPFMLNAYRAGTIAAVMAGVIGWFMVLRKQSFAGHTLALVGFPGAAAATLAGIAVGYGYFGFSLAAALVIAALRRRGQGGYATESAATGTIQALLLASGFLFIALYRGFLSGINAFLFGSFLGITEGQVIVMAVVGLAVLATVTLFGRRLWFASVDPQIAAAQGVNVTAIGVAFLMLLAAAAAATGQITGTLLVFALLVTPAATARQITARPVAGIALSVAIGVCATWAGLFIAYYTPYPLGFLITTIAFTAYVLTGATRWALTRRQVAAP